MKANNKSSAMAFVEAAAEQLTENMSFNSEAELANWMKANFDSVVEKARELQIEAMMKFEGQQGSELRSTMAKRVWSRLQTKTGAA